MANAQKKVILRGLGGELAWGYLPPRGFVVSGGVEFLEVGGKVKHFPVNEIKWVATVKDFNLDDAVDPERIGRTGYLGRPREEGLWVKVWFRDGDSLEGVAHFDTGFLERLLEDLGFSMTVPEARSNTQRVFVPRAAIESLEVLGYIGAPGMKKKALEKAAAQPGLFGE